MRRCRTSRNGYKYASNLLVQSGRNAVSERTRATSAAPTGAAAAPQPLRMSAPPRSARHRADGRRMACRAPSARPWSRRCGRLAARCVSTSWDRRTSPSKSPRWTGTVRRRPRRRCREAKAQRIIRGSDVEGCNALGKNSVSAGAGWIRRRARNQRSSPIRVHGLGLDPWT